MKNHVLKLVLCATLLLTFACKDDETVINNVPMASFSLSGGQLYPNCPVEFINASSDAISYLWDFGDGNTSTETAPTHTYETAGTYTITLTVSDENTENKVTQTVQINQGSLTFENIHALGNLGRYEAVVNSLTGGGYVLAGYTLSLGDYDVYLTKVDAKGNMQWEKTFGGSDFDEASAAMTTSSDGGYVLAGYSESQVAGNKDVYLIKVDTDGNLQWEKTFGGSDHDEVSAITNSSDGGYVLAGYTRSQGVGLSDFYLIKVDAGGNLQWEKTFGGSDSDVATAITTSPDGGYVLVGYTGGLTNRDIYSIKVDANGNLQWEKTFGESGFLYYGEAAYAIISSSDGGYILAGYKDSQGVSRDAYLIKVDADGNLQWGKNFGGSDSEIAYAIVTSSDGGYVLTGVSNQGAGITDIYLMKVDADGNLQWEKTFGESDSDVAYSIKATDECGYGYIIAGRHDADFYLIKTDGEGNIN